MLFISLPNLLTVTLTWLPMGVPQEQEAAAQPQLQIRTTLRENAVEVIPSLTFEPQSASPAAAHAPAPTRSMGGKPQNTPFAPVASDLVIEVGADGSAPSLARFSEQYARITGQHLVCSDETRALLENTRTPLEHSVNVPAAGVQTFFESILAASRLLILPQPNTEPPLVRIVSLETQDRTDLAGHWIPVPVDEVAVFCARHPATLVGTSLKLDTDVRQLSNAIRTLSSGSFPVVVLPAGTSNTLLISGTARTVANIVGILSQIDFELLEDRSAGGAQTRQGQQNRQGTGG